MKKLESHTFDKVIFLFFTLIKSNIVLINAIEHNISCYWSIFRKTNKEKKRHEKNLNWFFRNCLLKSWGNSSELELLLILNGRMSVLEKDGICKMGLRSELNLDVQCIHLA